MIQEHRICYHDKGNICNKKKELQWNSPSCLESKIDVKVIIESVLSSLDSAENRTSKIVNDVKKSPLTTRKKVKAMEIM